MNIDRATTEISTKLKYIIKNKYLLLTALTRQSAISENEKALHANISSQRLEFIGDSVLGLIITKQLYQLLTTANKDQLQRIKQSIISNKTLGKLGHELDLERFLVVGKSEKENINSNNKAIKEYERYVESKQPKDAPYKRLCVLYRKENDSDNEVRVIETAIEVFEGTKKVDYFEKRLAKLK